MGSAVSLGLIKSGAKVLMLDKTSRIYRASKANFGLVWSQSKGDGNRTYTRLSEKAVREYPQFIGAIEEESGVDTELRLGCGVIICLGEAELAARAEFVQRMARQAQAAGEAYPARLIDRDDLQQITGKTPLGTAVSGGSFSPIDGDVNPLLLLKAMRKIFIDRGGRFLHDCKVNDINRSGNNYLLDTTAGRIEVPKIIFAAGLGNIDLLSSLGLPSPIISQKGQILVTERVRPFLSFPFSGLRQTGCGSILIGYTSEPPEFKVRTTVSAGASMAHRALKILPCLERVKVVRSWAALRVLTIDGAPVYDEVAENAYLLASHSCITLASMHEQLLPAWILGKPMPEAINPFTTGRFHVRTNQGKP